MNLSDMLGYADIGQLSRIADVYQCECNGNSKNELIQSILSTVSRRDVFEAQISGMKLEDLRFLNSLLFESRDSYSLEDLIARVQQSRFGDESVKKETPIAKEKLRRGKKKDDSKEQLPSPREMIATFKHRGWLFNGFSGPGRYLFQVPNDLKVRFKDTMKRKFIEALQYTDEPPMYRDEQQLMSEDVTQFLHYTFHNDVQLLADGSMYKRFTQQILDRLGVREELPAKGEWRFGYGRHFNHYPNRFSLLYDYCYSVKYISESESVLIVTSTGKERLSLIPQEEARHLYDFWLKHYKGSVSHLLSLVHWVNMLAEQWVTLESLRNVLVPFIKPYFYDNGNAILEQRILMMMMHMGMIRVGEHPLYGTVVRMTKAGRAIVSGRWVEAH